MMVFKHQRWKQIFCSWCRELPDCTPGCTHARPLLFTNRDWMCDVLILLVSNLKAIESCASPKKIYQRKLTCFYNHWTWLTMFWLTYCYPSLNFRHSFESHNPDISSVCTETHSLLTAALYCTCMWRQTQKHHWLGIFQIKSYTEGKSRFVFLGFIYFYFVL